jgi:hypothetical protein
MTNTNKTQTVKQYQPSLAMQIIAQRAALAQPATLMTIGSTGLNYTRSMGGNEASRL